MKSRNMLIALGVGGAVLLLLYLVSLRSAVAHEHALQQRDASLQGAIAAEHRWLERFAAEQAHAHQTQAKLGIRSLITDPTTMTMRFEHALLSLPKCKVGTLTWTDETWQNVVGEASRSPLADDDAAVNAALQQVSPATTPTPSASPTAGTASSATLGISAPRATSSFDPNAVNTPTPINLVKLSGRFKLLCPYPDALTALNTLSQARGVLVGLDQVKWTPEAGAIIGADASFSLYRVNQ